jgi:transcriptional regulator with XRE-family HTH domain
MQVKANHLGKAIRERRNELKLSQFQVCLRLGIKNGQYLYNIEKGKCTFPTHRVLELSSVLMMPLDKIKNLMVLDYLNAVDTEIQKLIERK